MRPWMTNLCLVVKEVSALVCFMSRLAPRTQLAKWPSSGYKAKRRHSDYMRKITRLVEHPNIPSFQLQWHSI